MGNGIGGVGLGNGVAAGAGMGLGNGVAPGVPLDVLAAVVIKPPKPSGGTVPLFKSYSSLVNGFGMFVL